MHHMIPKLIIKSINIFKRNILVVFKKKKIIKKRDKLTNFEIIAFELEFIQKIIIIIN